MFKKVFLKLAIVAVLVSISTSSCNKWLDLKPQDGITGAEFWKTKEQVQAAVMGCYAALLGTYSGSRTLAESAFLWGELRADMISSTTGTLGEENDIINVNILPTNSITNWRTIYQIIN